MALFKNRKEAGRELAKKLQDYQNRADMLVLALSRDSIPVARAAADAFNWPVDLFLVRDLESYSDKGMLIADVTGEGDLQKPEWQQTFEKGKVFGAVTSDGGEVLHYDLVRQLGLEDSALNSLLGRERELLEQEEKVLRGDRPRPDLAGKTIILMDDGLNTPTAIQSAGEMMRRRGARRVVVAVPFADLDRRTIIGNGVDEVVTVYSDQGIPADEKIYSDLADPDDEAMHRLLSSGRDSD